MKRGRIIQAIEAALNGYHDGCPKLAESMLREILRVLYRIGKVTAINNQATEEHPHISDRRSKMDELISKTALLTHLRKERDEYLRVHFKQDPATGCWEGNTPEEEYLGDLEDRIDFIEQFPPVEPIGKLVNNNQPGWINIIETAPNVTIDVGMPVYVPGYPR